MKNKKQEVIKKAYGEQWEQVKDYVDEDGWIEYSNIDISQMLEIENRGDGYDDNIFYRPQSLAGIETNNGWIKIESEDNLPKDAIEKETDFWLSINNISFIGYFYFAVSGLKYCCRDYNSLPKEIKGVHIGEVKELQGYQPIIKPQPPIY